MLWIPILEEATFGGQILEKVGPEARFLSLVRPDSQILKIDMNY